ncbi:hypothetical protein ABZ832_29855 [Streptantibioticus parmotrematis]|uniref:SCO2583 family membrane protein n=1 Tax=Streptantibioticus parmotrematis TaxID=2873249 RepID=UPI0034078E70
MTGRGDPPEGTPQGLPGGGDDEYGAIVFDESFVRAARIREFSARERLAGATRATRPRHPWGTGGARPQAYVLVLLIALAFGSAIYLGVRHHYRPEGPPAAAPLRMTLVPLVPPGPVPAASADPLYAADGVAHYPIGLQGVTLPAAHRTAHFTDGQVGEALDITQEYLVASSLDEAALTGGDVREVRDLLDQGQLTQFDHSLASPADDGRHAATGWLVRFDPARYQLADPGIRVRGTVTYAERDGGAGLEVDTDHTLVYRIRAAGAPSGHPASLFTVRRRLSLYFDRDDLAARQLQLRQAAVEAGPLACASDPSGYFRPLLAGQRAATGSGTDPYDRAEPMAAACGALSPGPGPAPGPDRSPGRSASPSR